MWVNQDRDTNQADFVILHPGSRTLFRYWERVRGERAAPRRSEIDLKQLRPYVGNLFVLERRRDIYRWRVAGTRVCELYRRDLTGGDSLADLDTFERATIGSFLAAVVETLQPCVLRFRLNTSERQTIGVEMLGVPVQSGPGDSIHVFGSLFPFRDASTMSYERITGVELSGARSIHTEHLPGDELVARLRAGPAGPRRPFQVVHGGRDE